VSYYAWQHEDVEGILKANSRVQAAALAAKRLGAISQRELPRVEELGVNLYRVVSGDGRHVVVEVFHYIPLPSPLRQDGAGRLGNRRPQGYVLQDVGEREAHVLSDRTVLAVISRYLAHGGTPEGADALWQVHERYRALYRRR
jgi:hypothetical protein